MQRRRTKTYKMIENKEKKKTQRERKIENGKRILTVIRFLIGYSAYNNKGNSIFQEQIAH